MLDTLMHNKLLQQIMRFALVGGLAFVIDFGLLLLLTEKVGLNYLTSATISFIVSVIVNYLLSIAWVFTAHKNIKKTKTKSAIQLVIFMALSVCGLFSFIVSVIVNYLLSIAWVFTAHKNIKKTKTKSAIQLVIFMALSVCGLLINNGIMYFSVEVLAISYIIGKLVATFVVMVFNFITRKILLEGKKTKTQTIVEPAHAPAI